MDQDLILVDHAEERLRAMLAHAGVEPLTATVPAFWPVFKEFCRMPVDHAPDTEILFQWGVYWTAPQPSPLEPSSANRSERFTFDFTRQFSVEDEDGAYDHMEQLNCTFYLDPTAELEQFKDSMWSMGFPDLLAFFTAVETSDVFQLVVQKYDPIGVQIVQGAV